MRALAGQQLRERKGIEFEFRGLGVDELRHLADTVGLKTTAHELHADAAQSSEEVSLFRNSARAALGRTIVNFSRAELGQPGGGHHAVVVANHRDEDRFLVDDPAGFKMPAFWVATGTLVRAMATFDSTSGVQRYRGYLVVEGEHGDPHNPFGGELSTSVILRK